MAMFVLVHGAWTGGWIWRRVRPLLGAAGHEVFTPTLAGMGDRSHLAEHEIDLETHVHDVTGVLAFEQLRDVVLVGHGYAGMVITGVVDHMPEAVGQLVYLDAVVPRDGASLFDLIGPERRKQLVRRAWVEGEGWRIPLPEDYGGLAGVDARWVQRFAVGQPVETFEQRLALGASLPGRITRSYIRCQGESVEAAAPDQPEPPFGWHAYDLATGHAPMVSAPQPLVELLLRFG